MNIKINRRELVDSLRDVLGPTLTKQNFPILSSVLIETQESELKLTTTDLDITTTTVVTAKVESQGKVLLPMKRFLSIVRELPEEEITLEKTKNILSITCGQAEFKVNTIKEDEFPKIQGKKEAVTIKILPETLEEIINKTAFCAGYEDINYVLSGVLFEIQENKIKAVATDGKRMAYIYRNLPDTQAEVKEKISFILPNKAVGEILKLTKEKQNPIHLSLSQNYIDFDLEKTTLTARQIEGEFPDYQQYIPKEKGNRLTINKEEFTASLKRISLLATTDFQGVKINLKKNKITIHKTNPQIGEAKEELEAGYQDTPFEIEFNPNYLLDALRQSKENQTTIDFFGPDKPAVVKEEGYIYLLLPIKS